MERVGNRIVSEDDRWRLESNSSRSSKKNLIKSTASNEEDCNNYWVEGRDQCQSLAKKYHFPSLAGKLWGEKNIARL